MNYPVKWFTSEMPGAPVVTGQPGGLVGLLDACLIDGWGLVAVDTITYDSATDEATLTVAAGHNFILHQVILISGANEAEFNGEQRVIYVDSTSVKFKPVHTPSVAAASGTLTAKVAPVNRWQKKFASGDNLRAVYQSTSQSRLSDAALYIDHSNTYTGASYNWDYNGANAIAEVYENITDIDTRTGLINPELYHVIRTAYSASASVLENAISWVLIADERLIYLFCNHYATANDTHMSGYVFGEFVSYKPNDQHGYIIHAGQATAQGSFSPTFLAGLFNAQFIYLQRGYDGTTTSQLAKFGGISVNASGGMGIHQLAGYPNQPDNALHYTDKVLITEFESSTPGALRGEMPGMGYPLQTRPLGYREIQTLSWRGRDALVMAITTTKQVSYIHQNGLSGAGQIFIDIEGSWRQ